MNFAQDPRPIANLILLPFIEDDKLRQQAVDEIDAAYRDWYCNR